MRGCRGIIYLQEDFDLKIKINDDKRYKIISRPLSILQAGCGPKNSYDAWPSFFPILLILRRRLFA